MYINIAHAQDIQRLDCFATLAMTESVCYHCEEFNSLPVWRDEAILKVGNGQK
jgi:hypothetical protein